MTPRQQRGIKGTFNFSVRDFLLLVSLVITGGNLFQCWKHSNEIDQLKKVLQPETRKADDAISKRGNIIQSTSARKPF